MSDNPTAFVVMPFEEEFEQIYDEVISSAFEKIGYEVNKADSLDTNRSILEDIVEGISDSDILIADLTTSNPNVFYEVGIAHGLGIPTILLTQDLDEIPFDLKSYEIINYSTDFTQIGELQDDLEELAEKHINGEIQFESPVSDYTEVSVSSSSFSDTDEVAGQEEESVESTEKEEPEKGILDYASEAEERRSDLESNVESITERTSQLEGKIMEFGEELNLMAEGQGQISPNRVNRLAKNLAREIEDYNESIEEDVESVEDNLTFMMTAYNKFIEYADPSEEEHREMLVEQRTDLEDFMETSQGNIDGVTDMKESLAELKGMNRELDQACNNLSAILTTLINTFTEANAKAERMISLIDQKLEE